MRISDFVEKVFGFLIKVVFGLFFLLIVLQVLCVWLSNLRQSQK